MLEAPGPRAEDLVSCGYCYATAENIRKFPEQVGLARERVVLWNIVPYFCFAPEAGKNRNPTDEEVDRASHALPDLLKLLIS